MTSNPDNVHPVVEAMARAISRSMNQHNIDIGFALEIDFKKLQDGSLDLERDWLECVPEAKAAAKVLLSMEPSNDMEMAGLIGFCDKAVELNKRCHEPTTEFGRGLLCGRTMHNGMEIRSAWSAMTAAARSEMGLEG